MRRELVMPLQFPCVRIEREDGVGIQIVAAAFIAVIVGAWISGGPIEQVRDRVVASGKPRGHAAVLGRLAIPRLRARTAWQRHCPELPGTLSRGQSVCR